MIKNFTCFQNDVKIKKLLFIAYFHFYADHTSRFENGFFLSHISNLHFTVGLSRNNKKSHFRLCCMDKIKSQFDPKKLLISTNDIWKMLKK